jgi:hypothetical protein
MKPGPAPPEPRILSDPEVANYTGGSEAYVRALAAQGILRPVEFPRTDGSPGRARMRRYDKHDIDKWLDTLPRG